MDLISRLSIHGFKSIESAELELRPLNVLIGPNGVGKSNLIDCVRMLNWMLGSDVGGLRQFTGFRGGPQAMVFDGPERTRHIDISVDCRTHKALNSYACSLAYSPQDFLFTLEKIRVHYHDKQNPEKWYELDVAGTESALLKEAGRTAAARYMLNLLRSVQVYQFHHTSFTSRLRTTWKTADSVRLKEDGGNLAPVLWRIRESDRESYLEIVETLQQLLPFFQEFVLETEGDSIRLRWRERESDLFFDASQASDGMLRLIALVTLLAGPSNMLPSVMLLDEPELGLHPEAIEVIAGMVKTVSRSCQVILATQSPHFLSQFDAKDVIVTEREGRASRFRRLDEGALAGWMGRYSLGQIWTKNLVGGNPIG